MFKRKREPLLTKKTNFPSGVVVKTEKGSFLVKKGALLRIPSDTVLMSWDFPLVIDCAYSAVSHMVIASKLGFRDGTALRSFADQKIYLVSEQKTRHIISPDAVRTLGITLEDILTVSEDDVRLHKEGEPLGSI